MDGFTIVIEASSSSSGMRRTAEDFWRDLEDFVRCERRCSIARCEVRFDRATGYIVLCERVATYGTAEVGYVLV